MKTCTLVTGAAGFTGRHLVGFLRGQNEGKVIAAGREAGDGIMGLDLADADQVRQAISRLRPSRIFHCAGRFTNVWESDFPANVGWTRHVLEAVREHDPACRVLLIGSAAEYGTPPEGPVAETAPLHPVTIYGVTKAMQTMLMGYYHRSAGMDVVMARTFNLFGPGCSPNLFPGRVAEQIERVRQGLQARIELHSLSSRRDYLPVGDAVRAYARIMDHGRSGEVYHVGSGFPVTMSKLLEQLLSDSGLTMADVTTSADAPTKTNVPEIYADLSKLNALPGGGPGRQ